MSDRRELRSGQRAVVPPGAVRQLALLLLVLGCRGNGRSTDTRSSALTDPVLKVKFLDEYAQGPTMPLAAEFHIVYHDNSGGLLAGPDDYDIAAVIRVRVDDVPRWSTGCIGARLEARPKWASELVDGVPGWEVKTPPDIVRCGREVRIIHVKEGVIFRHIATM